MSRAIGQVTTSSASRVGIESAPYNEPTVGAQRSFKSSSASDAAAGTGVRTVRVTYYTLGSDGTISGPYTEDVILNGLTAVPTVATNIALVEKFVALTVGSGGVAAGDISLQPAADGTGTAIAKLLTGDVATYLGHHYVPTGYRCTLKDLQAIGGDAAAALVDVAVQSYPTTAPEQTVTGPFGVTSTLPRSAVLADGGIVPGPARLRLRVKPANTNAQTTYASFGYADSSFNAG